MKTPSNHESLAAALREQPPVLDDLAKARLERRIVQRASSDTQASPPQRMGVPIAVGVGLAAAAALALYVSSQPAVEASPVAHFEVREIDASEQRGTLEQGSILATDSGQVADITVRDSEIHLEPGSRLRISELSAEQLSLELFEGEVRVGFHPRQRGSERLTIETSAARVEVVGTVFTVRAAPLTTRVSVREGTVRVVPREGGASLVGAGEELTVRAGEVQAGEAQAAHADPEVEVDPALAVDLDLADESTEQPPETGSLEPSPSEPTRDAPSPAAELNRARSLIHRGAVETAEPILLRLTARGIPVRTRTEAWTLLADVREGRGELAAAVDAYDRAAEAGGRSIFAANAIYARAHLEERRLNDASAARVSYRRYLEVAPSGALATQARSALCRLGDEDACEPTP